MRSNESRQLVGLDVGSRSVKLIELDRAGSAVELKSIAMAIVEDHGAGPGYQEAIASVIETAGVTTRRVATAVSGPHVAVRGLQFPRLSRKELEGAVWYEGGQVIPFDIREAYVDYSTLPDARGGKSEVLFVAARQPEVDARLELLRSCGLEPRTVTVDAIALMNAILDEPELPETVAVLDIGATTTGFGVARRGALPFIRDIDIAGNTYTQAVMNALGVSYAEAEQAKVVEAARNPAVVCAVENVTRQLVGELSRSLMYYQTRDHGSKAELICVCGGCSQIYGLDEVVSAEVGIPVRRWSALDQVLIDESRFDRSAVNDLAAFVSLAAALARCEDSN